MRMNKRGILPIIAFVFLALLSIYVVLWFPIPAFTSIRSVIHYALMIIFWVSFQVGLVYGYYKLGILIAKGIGIYRGKMHLWTVNVKHFMLQQRR